MTATIIGFCLALMVGPSIVEAITPTASVYGRVTDLFGTPIPDAVVEVTAGKDSPKFSVRTNQDGSYLVRDLAGGEVTLAGKAPGFLPETETLLLPVDGQVLLDFGLQPGSLADRPPVKLSGTVQSRNKASIKDATVTVVNAFNRRLVKTAKTDNRGRYQVEHEDGGQYVVYASKPGFLVSTVAVVLPAAMPRKRQINLMLIPVSGSIYGP